MAFNKFLIFVVVALIFAAYQVQSANLIIGTGPSGGSLVYSTNATRNAILGNVQTQDVIYRGFAINITYITAMEVGASQNATARLVGGGLNMPNCTLRFTSAVSRGYNYTIQVWGRS
ncbi:uncharacterized protein LOC143909745 [Arctopsyche grandis]|uniref:uncharacterized protein LOC143909745 n=1 Tax=Arctopsyche grandis TaxID=121162 RepID=UPI00406D7B8E